MILHSESDNRGGDRVSTTFEEDFQLLPQFTQTRTSNATYTNITTVKHNPDGSTTQSLQIVVKR